MGYRPQCPLCGRVYSSTSNLRQHMLNVHSQTDRDQWFPCQHCGKKCKTKHYLINHQLQAHDAAAWGALANPAVSDCVEDEGEMRGNELLKYLEESEHAKGAKLRGEQLQCPLCFARLESLALARRHLEAHYPRDSPVCPVATCARYFAHPNSVRNHMRIKHRRQWEKMKTLKWSCGWAN
ncbi:zinc finger autosomal protein-like [Aphomia sociella]